MRKLFGAGKYVMVILIGIMLCAFANAQSTTPRFGTKPNEDNTGRALTYRYSTATDTTGADSVVLTPRAWTTTIKVALLDSFTLKQPIVTQSYLGDQITIIASGASGTKLKFNGSNWITAGTATLSSGLRAVIRLVFDGAKWVEASRVVQ